MNPTRHGVGMPPFLTVSGSLVHAYVDGTVLITHGGVEMGQGLNTKVLQIASKTLGIPIEKIYINETSSDKIHNATPTGGSVGSDLWCNTAKIACEILLDRFAPLRKEHPDHTFAQLCELAYKSRVNCVAQGWYCPKSDDAFFRYFVYGVACSEVSIDILTGQYTILRSDVLMDLGKSLNPLVDIGQVEGGFVQGLGLFALEEFLYDDKGNIITKTEKYKIPTLKDIPKDFRVYLLKDSNPSDSVLLGSKGVGEPPLFLGSTVYFAIKDVIQTLKQKHVIIGSPITYEKIKMNL
jgi:xanthine dehydrogenase/oxidase